MKDQVYDTGRGVCQFGDLDEHARERALALVQHQLADCRWEGEESDELTNAVTLALAAALGMPAGAPDVEVVAWNPHRSRHLTIAGVLHRGNSPALQWCRHIHSVSLTGCGRVTVHTDGAAAPAALAPIVDAVQNAVATAWQAARAEVLRRQALEWIAGTQPVFDQAGAPFPRP